MRVQPVNNQNNISMRRLIFPKYPTYNAVVSHKIKKVIRKNPYIKSLSKSDNVLARFYTNKNGIHYLRLDVFEKGTNKELFSTLYSSRMHDLNGGKTHLFGTDFINHVQEPKTTINNNNVREVETQTDYYNFSFIYTSDDYQLDGITPDTVQDVSNEIMRNVNRLVISQT